MKQKIRELVNKYEQNREHYRSTNFNETSLRTEFLDALFLILGWDIANIAGQSTNEREVLLEESLRDAENSQLKKPDYTFRLFGERKFFLEAKKPHVNINEDSAPAKQVRRYGYTAGLKISVLSNFEDFYIYDTTIPVEDDDTLQKALIKHYHYSEYEEKIEELASLLGRDSIYSGHFDEIWQNVVRHAETHPVDKLFLKQINDWRLLLGKQILSAMPDIDIEQLGDVVQNYINKIIFLRVCEDRNIEQYQRLLQIANTESHGELVSKFKQADQRYNSGLFEQQLSDEVIDNISSSFWIIIRQLYYPESPYSFAVLSSDILGRIYEIFLSKKLALVDGELQIIDKPENQDRDIVTTPDYIVREILRQTMNSISTMTDEQILSIKCADIACGSGAFLLETYQLLCDTLIDYYLRTDRTLLVQTGINTYKLPFETKRTLLTQCIYGVDKDFNAVEACKFGLLLKLLEGENEATLDRFLPILPTLDENIFYGNSLLSVQDVADEDIEIVNPFDFVNLNFDFIVGNPPYMKTEDVKKFTPKEHSIYPQIYTSAYKQYDKYFLFVERACSLLKQGGILGYILPSKFMKVGAAVNLRNFITSNKYLKSLSSFGHFQVFSDKSNYTCILILQKQENHQFTYTEIKNLNKWKVRDEQAALTGTWDANTITQLTWILCADDLRPTYNSVMAISQPLSAIVGDGFIFNGIQTSANEVYIFKPIREDEHYYFFYYKDNEYQIEKTITKPYFKTSRGEDSLYSYRTLKPNARVIFPYRRNEQNLLEIIPLDTIQTNYPCLYYYLQHVQDVLSAPNRDIKPTPTNPNEWHRYGRHQSLEACEIAEKIIVGVLSQSDKYAIDTQGTLVTSGGTAGYCLISTPEESPYSIYYIQAILGSKQGEWFASLFGEVFRGGFIARGTKVLKQIPIPVINFDNAEQKQLHDHIVDVQKQLISLGDRIAENAGNNRKLIPLQRQFKRLKNTQQANINHLYGMDDTAASKIPSIKELYATD